MDSSAKDKIEHAVDHLSDLSKSIDDGIKETESPFLALGQALQTAYSESGDLISIIKGSVDRFSDASGNNLVNEVESVIHDVLGELTGYPAKIDADMEHISGSAQFLEKLRGACSNLSNISRFLHIIGLNIGIEGCRSPETNDMFRGFDEEIKDLAKKISETTEKIHTDATEVIAGHEKGLPGISQKVDILRKLTDEAENAVMKTMENVRALSDHSCKTLDNAEQTAQAIQNRTGEIVMAIQFHDIARQRLEHVISSFEDVQKMFDQKRLSWDTQASDSIKIPPQIISTLNIQSEQIIHVADEIEQAHGNITASLDDIRSQVAELKNLLDESSGSGDRRSGLEKELESMTVQMNSLKQLDIQARSLGDELISTIRKSSDVVTDLSRYADQITNINTNIQYKALNAIIMTNKLGKKGATLEVLAREVGNISVECNRLVKDTLDNLESISSLTARLTAPKADNHDKAGNEADLEESIDGISMAVDAYSRDSVTVSKGAQDLAEKIDQTGKGLLFLSAWIEQLRQVPLKLNEIISSIEPFVDEDAENDTTFSDETMSERYTMQSERHIHERVSGKNRDKAASEKASPDKDKRKPMETDKQTEEFDDNVELF